MLDQTLTAVPGPSSSATVAARIDEWLPVEYHLLGFEPGSGTLAAALPTLLANLSLIPLAFMARRRKTYGFSFSWKRALGISAAKNRISRKIGIPLTRSGRQRAAGRAMGCCVPLFVMAGSAVGLLCGITAIVAQLA